MKHGNGAAVFVSISTLQRLTSGKQVEILSLATQHKWNISGVKLKHNLWFRKKKKKTNLVNWFYLDNSFSARTPCINPEFAWTPHIVQWNIRNNFPTLFIGGSAAPIVIAWASINFARKKNTFEKWVKNSSAKELVRIVYVLWFCWLTNWLESTKTKINFRE